MQNDSVQRTAPVDEKTRLLDMYPCGGNYFILAVESSYIANNAKPGQFAMLRVDGAMTRRPFSIYNTDEKNRRVEFYIKALGYATTKLSKISPLETIDIIGPLGNPFDLDLTGRVVLIGGGTGVAPLFFSANILKKKNLPMHLFYGGKSRADIHIEDFGKIGTDAHIATEDGSYGDRGLVTDIFQKWLEQSDIRDFSALVCGPKPMMKAADEMLDKYKIPAQFALEEYMACGIGVCLSCVVKTSDGDYVRVCTEGPVFKSGEIVW